MTTSAEEIQFLKKYTESKPMLSAWGGFVVERIKETVKKSIEHKQFSVESFFKVSPCYRLKEDESLRDKAFRRGKNYIDPWNQITDKVGCRFVVLLLSDIQIVEDAIKNIDAWTFSHDRDFNVEKINDPEKFAYQSQHYVLKCKDKLELDGVTIPQGTPCEVQIRTLMQHAYSEMSHDFLYKSKFQKQNQVVRMISRCSAMIESTDELFDQAKTEICKYEETFDNLCSMTLEFLNSNGALYELDEQDENIARRLIKIWTDEKVKEYSEFLGSVALDYLKNEKNLGTVSNIQILFFVKRYKLLFEQMLDDLGLPEEDYRIAYIAAGELIPTE